MKKFLPGLFALVCSLLLLTGLTAPVLAVEPSVTGTQKKQEKHSCETVKAKLQKEADRLLQKAALFKATYDKAAVLNEKQVDESLLAQKKAAVEQAMTTAKADVQKVACPASTLKSSMKQVEKDLRDVTKALQDYRKAIRGLKGKPETSTTPAPVLGAQTKQAVCSEAKVTAKKAAMTKIITTAQMLQAKYALRAKTSGALPTTQVQIKKAALEAALTKAKQDIAMLVCENGSMEVGVKAFKTDMQTALTALKMYRQVLLDSAPDNQQTDLEKDVTTLPIIQ